VGLTVSDWLGAGQRICRAALARLGGLDYNAGLPELPLRYLILSDIHSNLEALEVCLGLAQGKYDQAVCLGDLVGYGPDPDAVIEVVKPLAVVIIRGNHDRACAGLTDASDFNLLARLATHWTRETLTPGHFEFLRDLPPGPVMMEDFQLVHGSVQDEDEYILGPGQALPALRELPTQVVCFGHTHCQGGFMLSPAGRYQSIRIPTKEDGRILTLPLEEGGRYLVNPGSIGQPRDGDWRAAFAILDIEQRTVEYYRTPYNLPATQEKMHRAGLPEPLIRRLEYGR
jgi:predicted phosphodiesterase